MYIIAFRWSRVFEILYMELQNDFDLLFTVNSIVWYVSYVKNKSGDSSNLWNNWYYTVLDIIWLYFLFLAELIDSHSQLHCGNDF